MPRKLEINVDTEGDDSGAKKVEGALKKTKREGSALGRVFRATGRIIGRVFRTARTAVIGFVVALAGAVREAVMFRIQMARAWTMMDGGIDQFREMSKEVRNLSGDLGVAKDQLAAGLYQALSKGIPETNVVTFLRTAGKVAVADGSDVITAVDGMTTVLNAFHLEAKDTDKVADALFKTVANGGTTFAELAGTIATVAPVASAAAIPLEQILAAIATLTKGGTPTAQAMTQIRAAIVGLNKVLGDGWSKTMSMQEAMVALHKQTGGSQTALMKLVGTVEGVMGVLGLAGINAQGAANDLREAADAAGSLDAAFEKVDRFRHWPKFWETIRGVITNIGTILDNTIAPLILDITEQIAKWRDADDVWKRIEERLVALREGVADLWAVFSEGPEMRGILLENLKGVISSAALFAAQKSVAFLIRQAAKIGSLIGRSVVAALPGMGRARARLAAETEAAATGVEVEAEEALAGFLGAIKGLGAMGRQIREQREEQRAHEAAFERDAAAARAEQERIEAARARAAAPAARPGAPPAPPPVVGPTAKARAAGVAALQEQLARERQEAEVAGARAEFAQRAAVGPGTLSATARAQELQKAAEKERADVVGILNNLDQLQTGNAALQNQILATLERIIRDQNDMSGRIGSLL